MNTKLERKLKFVRREAATCGNPCARLSGAFVLLRACFKDQGNKLKSGSPELAAAAYAAGKIVGTVSLLDRHMDDYFHLGVLKRRHVDSAIDSLMSEYVNQNHVVGAMDFANEAIQEMLEGFSEATFNPTEAAERFVDEFDEEEGVTRRQEAERQWELRMAKAEFEIARLRLALFLPRLAELMERVWMPLKEQIERAQRPRSSEPK